MDWDNDISNLPARKEMLKMGFYKNIWWKTSNLQTKTSKKSWCVRRVKYGEKQSSSPPKKAAPKLELTEESTINTRSTHHLKQATVCVTRSVQIKNQANSHSDTRQAIVCVTRRVHIKNQANSHSETRQAIVCVTRRMHIKNHQLTFCKRMARACIFRRVCDKRTANSPPKKRIARGCFSSVQNKMQESIPSEIAWSPEQCTRKGKAREWVTKRDNNRGTTYNLRHGRFRRELSQNQVILKFYNHLPTKKIC